MAFTYHLEGGEAVGKTETIGHTADLLRNMGYTVHVVDEPSSKLGMQAALRDLAINSEMSDNVRALIMWANRASLHEELAELPEQDIVLISRSFISTLVYQGHDELRPLLDHMREVILGKEDPLVCLFECETKEALRRLGERPVLDVIEKQVISQYEHIRDRYRQMWDYDYIVDTTHTTAIEVAQNIAERIADLHFEKFGK